MLCCLVCCIQGQAAIEILSPEHVCSSVLGAADAEGMLPVPDGLSPEHRLLWFLRSDADGALNYAPSDAPVSADPQAGI